MGIQRVHHYAWEIHISYIRIYKNNLYINHTSQIGSSCFQPIPSSSWWHQCCHVNSRKGLCCWRQASICANGSSGSQSNLQLLASMSVGLVHHEGHLHHLDTSITTSIESEVACHWDVNVCNHRFLDLPVLFDAIFRFASSVQPCSASLSHPWANCRSRPSSARRWLHCTSSTSVIFFTCFFLAKEGMGKLTTAVNPLAGPSAVVSSSAESWSASRTVSDNRSFHSCQCNHLHIGVIHLHLFGLFLDGCDASQVDLPCFTMMTKKVMNRRSLQVAWDISWLKSFVCERRLNGKKSENLITLFQTWRSRTHATATHSIRMMGVDKQDGSTLSLMMQRMQTKIEEFDEEVGWQVRWKSVWWEIFWMAYRLVEKIMVEFLGSKIPSIPRQNLGEGDEWENRNG